MENLHVMSGRQMEDEMQPSFICPIHAPAA
jgi:hypothetical protein